MCLATRHEHHSTPSSVLHWLLPTQTALSLESPSADDSNFTAAKLAENHLKKDIYTKNLLEIKVWFHASSSQRNWEQTVSDARIVILQNLRKLKWSFLKEEGYDWVRLEV